MVGEKGLEPLRIATLVPKDNTAYIYKCALKSTLSDWLDKPLIEIKKDMVERRHKSITDKGHAGHADHTMRILRALFTYAMITYEHPDGEPIFTSNPFIEDRVGKDVLDLSVKKPRVLRMESKKKAQS